jgi:transcription initiation factor TFIIIB Brf1 subunit/transcription initiation factor TFIIB
MATIQERIGICSVCGGDVFTDDKTLEVSCIKCNAVKKDKIIEMTPNPKVRNLNELKGN